MVLDIDGAACREAELRVIGHAVEVTETTGGSPKSIDVERVPVITIHQRAADEQRTIRILITRCAERIGQIVILGRVGRNVRVVVARLVVVERIEVGDLGKYNAIRLARAGDRFAEVEWNAVSGEFTYVSIPENVVLQTVILAGRKVFRIVRLNGIVSTLECGRSTFFGLRNESLCNTTPGAPIGIDGLRVVVIVHQRIDVDEITTLGPLIGTTESDRNVLGGLKIQTTIETIRIRRNVRTGFHLIKLS